MLIRLLRAVLRLRRIPADGVYVLTGTWHQRDRAELQKLASTLPDVQFIMLENGAKITRVGIEAAIRKLRTFDKQLRKRQQRIEREAR